MKVAFISQKSCQKVDPTMTIYGMSLPRKKWALMSRFRTQVGKSNFWKYKWELILKYGCEADIKTMDHMGNDCYLHSFRDGLAVLQMILDAVLE